MTDKLRTFVFQGLRQDPSPGPTFSEFEIEIEAYTAADALVMFETNTKAEAESSFPRRYFRLQYMQVKRPDTGPTADAESARYG